MSDRKNNNVAAVAGIVVGVGALIGAAYAGYQYLSSRNESSAQSSAPLANRSSSNRVVPSARLLPAESISMRPEKLPEKGKETNRCSICRRDIDSEDFLLECSHSFHKECLLANYILSQANDQRHFCCPILNCKRIVSDVIIQILISRGFSS